MALRLFVRVGGLVLIGLAGLGAFCFALAHVPHLQQAVFNSDQVQPYLVVQDAFRDPSSLLSWHHSPALFAFPDWVVAALFTLAGLPNLWMPFAYAAVVTLGLTGLVALAVAGSGARAAPGPGAMWIAAALFIGSWMLLAAVEPDAPVQFLSFLTIPAYHSGAVLGCVYGAYLATQSGRLSRRAAAAHVGLLFLFCFSDTVTLGWLLAPLGLCWALAAWRARRADWRMLGVLVAGGLGLLGGFAFSLREPANRTYLAHRVSVHEALAAAWDMVRAGGLGFDLCLAIGLLVVAWGVRAALRRQDGPRAQQDLYLAAVVVMALAVPIVSGRFTDIAQWRFALCLPAVALVWLTRLLVKPGTPATLAACTLVAVLAVVSWTQRPLAVAATYSRSELVACLLDNGLRDGIGDYWSAKDSIFRSSRAVHIAQIEGDSPLEFNFNHRWLRQRADGGPFAPDFVVLNGLDAETVRRRFGAPDGTVACGTQAVWTYARPLRFP